MHSFLVLLSTVLLAAAPAAADGGHDHGADGKATAGPAPEGDFQAVLSVSGLVCSFCAVGAAKALAKVPGLDANRFNDGVHVDIENQKVTLAFKPGAAIPVAQIRDATLSAGYDPIALHVELAGWDASK